MHSSARDQCSAMGVKDSATPKHYAATTVEVRATSAPYVKDLGTQRRHARTMTQGIEEAKEEKARAKEPKEKARRAKTARAANRAAISGGKAQETRSTRGRRHRTEAGSTTAMSGRKLKPLKELKDHQPPQPRPQPRLSMHPRLRSTFPRGRQ